MAVLTDNEIYQRVLTIIGLCEENPHMHSLCITEGLIDLKIDLEETFYGQEPPVFDVD